MARRRVIIVERDIELRHHMADLVAADGGAALVGETFEQAKRAMRRGTPDAVFLDAGSRKGGQAQLVHQMRTHWSRSGLVVTGDADDLAALQSADDGGRGHQVDGVLIKPFTDASFKSIAKTAFRSNDQRMQGGRTVLLVDRDPDMRRALKTGLDTHSWHVCEAHDEETAQAWIADSPVAAMVVDLFMPGLSGLELIAAMTQFQPKAKIIALVGGDVAPAKLRSVLDIARETGVLEVLPKPLDVDTLRVVIARVVSDAAVVNANRVA